jgi:GNAT superfamily N-acetyltransferase
MGDELTIRLARPGDRADMERICAGTWEWGDYVPEAWDDWLADQARALAGDLSDTGMVLAGEWRGGVVALSRIQYLTPEEVWLEAMRVDPAYRQRGIAGRFLETSLSYARTQGARVVRLGTGEHNTPVHIIAARAGMARVGSYVLWTAEARADSRLPVVLGPEHLGQVKAFLEQSPVLAHTGGLFSVHWTWQELTPQRAGQFLEEASVVAIVGADARPLALATCHLDSEDGVLWVGFVDGESLAVQELATEIRARAAQVGADRVRIMLPDVHWLRESWSAAGYGFGHWEGELLIYEQRLRPESQKKASGAGHEDCPKVAGGGYGD